MDKPDDFVWLPYAIGFSDCEALAEMVPVAARLAQMLRAAKLDGAVVCGVGFIDQGLVSGEHYNRRVTELIAANNRLVEENRTLQHQLDKREKDGKVLAEILINCFGNVRELERLAACHGEYNGRPGTDAINTINSLEAQLKCCREIKDKK